MGFRKKCPQGVGPRQVRDRRGVIDDSQRHDGSVRGSQMQMRLLAAAGNGNGLARRTPERRYSLGPHFHDAKHDGGKSERNFANRTIGEPAGFRGPGDSRNRNTLLDYLSSWSETQFSAVRKGPQVLSRLSAAFGRAGISTERSKTHGDVSTTGQDIALEF
ncbi:hypothetical protein DL769_006546 [Monosporascus sp. CRB-8-3]|nr:hypothetical protein DL769_006546 [Monosporascus sp. CRB-8-3]